jgi:hypothetical protein
MQPRVRVRDAGGLRNAVQLVKGLDTKTGIAHPDSTNCLGYETWSIVTAAATSTEARTRRQVSTALAGLIPLLLGVGLRLVGRSKQAAS